MTFTPVYGIIELTINLSFISIKIILPIDPGHGIIKGDTMKKIKGINRKANKNKRYKRLIGYRDFIGSIEAREIPNGGADVIVCEAFVGNVILKMYEGVGEMILGAIKGALMSSTRGKIGGLLIKPSFKEVMKQFDATEYGGAPLLGLNGLVVKVHGNATSKEISNAIRQCVTFKEQKISQRIADKILIKDE